MDLGPKASDIGLWTLDWSLMVAAGQAIGPFQVERLLARGGMGEAFLARDTRSGERVLLKLPAPELLGNVAAHTRFERESEALRRLNHPGIQRWVEAGQLGLRPYVALRYVDGQSLGDLLRARGSLPAAEAVPLAAALAAALAYAHEHGVVHRDVKPENVILDSSGQPILIDFGSVLLEGARRLTYSKFSGELGTPEYMAPEQVQGRRGDPRTDVYALGTLIYEMLTGQPPFAAQPGDSAVQVMRRHLEATPRLPSTPGLDDALLGVLAKSLAREPQERYQSMAEFRDALLDPAGAVARGIVRPGWPATWGSAVRAGFGAPMDEPQSLGDWLRYIAIALGVLLAIVLLALLATYFRPVPPVR